MGSIQQTNHYTSFCKICSNILKISLVAVVITETKNLQDLEKKTRKVIERIWYQYTTYNFKNIITGDWGDGLVVKRTYSSYRGPVLTSQNSFLCISQAPVAPGL